jgi:hypothetical protein
LATSSSVTWPAWTRGFADAVEADVSDALEAGGGAVTARALFAGTVAKDHVDLDRPNLRLTLAGNRFATRGLLGAGLATPRRRRRRPRVLVSSRPSARLMRSLTLQSVR